MVHNETVDEAINDQKVVPSKSLPKIGVVFFPLYPLKCTIHSSLEIDLSFN